MTVLSPGRTIPVQTTRVRLCFGWDPIPKEPVTAGRIKRIIAELYRSGDLPPTAEFRTVAVLSDRRGEVLTTVYRDALYGADGAVAHEGDRPPDPGRTSTGSVFVDLTRVPVEVDHIWMAVGSLSTFGLSVLAGLHCRLVDDDSTEIARYDSTYRGPFNTEVLARLTRGDAGSWTIGGVGRTGSCSSIAKVAQFAARAVR